jgi:hypothetical protein
LDNLENNNIDDDQQSNSSKRMFENHHSEEKAEFVQIEMRTFESDLDYANSS